jgi:hypothetical protein
MLDSLIGVASDASLDGMSTALREFVQTTLEQAVKAWDGGAAQTAGALLIQGVEMLRQKSIGYV